ncbi:hypothetical protein MARI151_20754 [Maribacter litoralis]|uniref:Uncharacterized protein n=1 Tax=Maribacter litoralis TaxID=2059726 RepID=A0A653R4Y5_9FLAO|nr:hypothetical protein MARI151_20754 [Maribacter litoralis]
MLIKFKYSEPKIIRSYRLLNVKPVDTLYINAYMAKAINTKHNQENTLK